MENYFLEEYLQESGYVDYSNPNIINLAKQFKSESQDEIELIQKTYYYVRDEINHSWDVQDHRITILASEVLENKVGICYAKSNLLAALLRVNGIPTGFSYQRLTLGDAPDTGYCIHALNTVYIQLLGCWIRLDARGNKEGVQAEFSLEEEKLAFEIKPAGEIDYHNNLSEPHEKTMQVLEESVNAIEMYLYNLPDCL